jgi:prepilin-type N-terminal cleavage/methylation domain-containing protein
MLENQTVDRRTPSLRARRGAGFTLIELLLVIVVIGILATAGIPAFVEMLWRSKVELAARQTTIQMRAARFQAIQEAQEHGVWADFANNRIVLFEGTDPPPTGTEVRSFELPGGIVFQGPADAAPNGTDAITFVTNEDATGGWVVFAADGSSDDAGDIRFAMAERDLFYATRVGPEATGKISLVKYRRLDDTWLE